MRFRATAALFVSALASMAACAQVFGLDTYHEQPEDGGADAPTDVTSSGDGPESDARPADAGPSGDARDSGSAQEGGDATSSADAAADGPTFSPDACTGATTCAPAPPSGWQGPLVLWEGSGSAPPCSGYFIPAFDGGTSLSAPPAQCVCSCGSPSGSTCGSATVQFATGGCGTTCGGGTVSLTPGACASVQSYTSACGSGAELVISGSTGSGGSCQPAASVTLPAPTWGTQAIACAPTAQSPLGCAAGEQCVPAPPSSFGSRFCVLKQGSTSCPPGAFAVQHLYYAGVGDTRACSPCTCATPAGVDCNSSAHVTTWGNPSCSANQGVNLTPLPVTCAGASSAHSLLLTTAPAGGSCAPDGGQPIGAVAPETITTICCTL